MIAVVKVRRGLDRLTVFVKFLEIVFFGNAAVLKLRKVPCSSSSFQVMPESPDCRSASVSFSVPLSTASTRMHVLAVFRQRFIRLFQLNLQCSSRTISLSFAPSGSFCTATASSNSENPMIAGPFPSGSTITSMLGKSRYPVHSGCFSIPHQTHRYRCFSVVCIFLTEGLIQNPADLYFLPVLSVFVPSASDRDAFCSVSSTPISDFL